jgi:hypothetical protein
MSDSLYEQDPFAWAQEQAAALRAPGSNSIDYENVAEEIESLGISIRRACRSQIENILEHLLKLEFIGPMEASVHWRKEVNAFRRELGRDLTPSLSSQLPRELDDLYAAARRALITDAVTEGRDLELPVDNPYSWDDLLGRGNGLWTPEPRYEARTA